MKPDGTIVATFSAANAFDAPGFDNSFAMSQTIEIGPRVIEIHSYRNV